MTMHHHDATTHTHAHTHVVHDLRHGSEIAHLPESHEHEHPTGHVHHHGDEHTHG
jgi:hypothetical protein